MFSTHVAQSEMECFKKVLRLFRLELTVLDIDKVHEGLCMFIKYTSPGVHVYIVINALCSRRAGGNGGGGG